VEPEPLFLIRVGRASTSLVTLNSYFTYYLAWVFFSYALRTPWLLLGLVALLVLRPFLPNPVALSRLFGRARSLRAQVAVNRANVTARRDLAVIYLDGLRARSAVPLLQEGLSLVPNDAELLYLLGLSLHRSGKHEEALAPLVRAVAIDPRVRYGAPFSVAGDALFALERWEGALDAYEHYQADNTSDVSGYTRLARCHAKLGDRSAARVALYEGIRTWGLLPGSMKRRQFGHFVRAHWARAVVLRDPAAVASLLVCCALLASAGYLAYRPVLGLFSGASQHERQPYNVDALDFARCGTQSTADFAGKYDVLNESGQQQSARDGENVLRNFEIMPDRIQFDSILRNEFCLTKVFKRTADSLSAEAVWHEDIQDPGDASLVGLRLERVGDSVTLTFWDAEDGPSSSAVGYRLRRH
jgi:tetratricopeptide (TPR) repeat protein